MISYTYQILSLKKHNDNFLNNIKSFKIRVTGTKGSESHYVEDEILLEMPSEESFIAYQDLTEQNIIDWYEDGIREEVARLDIQRKFDLNKGTETSSFPWSE
tara:strand:+ start:331 stop:636 length:306 start_codon:yes stop_codon:yes gene_type:complete